MWVGDTECQKSIENFSDLSQLENPLFRVTKRCNKNLAMWNKKKFENIQRRLR